MPASKKDLHAPADSTQGLPQIESKALVTQDCTLSRRGRKPVEVDEKLIEDAVEFIKAKSAEHLYRGAIEIGEYVINTFFEGDPEIVSSKNPKKAASFRKLGERPDLPISFTTLNRMVGVAKQERLLQLKGIAVEQLNYTHRLGLLGLQDEQAKLDMAQKIISESLSAREIRRVIVEERKKMPGGREKQSSKIDPSVKEMREFLRGTAFNRFDFNEQSLRKLDTDERNSLKDAINSVLQKLKGLNRGFKKILDDLDTMEKESSEQSDEA